jgi:hypothetical protein
MVRTFYPTPKGLLKSGMGIEIISLNELMFGTLRMLKVIQMK